MADADGEGAVGVGLPCVFLGDEFFAGQLAHDVEHFGVGDVACYQVVREHVLAVGGELVVGVNGDHVYILTDKACFAKHFLILV